MCATASLELLPFKIFSLTFEGIIMAFIPPLSAIAVLCIFLFFAHVTGAAAKNLFLAVSLLRAVELSGNVGISPQPFFREQRLLGFAENKQPHWLTGFAVLCRSNENAVEPMLCNHLVQLTPIISRLRCILNHLRNP